MQKQFKIVLSKDKSCMTKRQKVINVNFIYKALLIDQYDRYKI